MSNKLGKSKMRRKDYESVKRMDRLQFDVFCRSLYEQGQQSVTKKSIEFDDVRAAILEVKGIGEKRADLIMEKLQKRIEGKANE